MDQVAPVAVEPPFGLDEIEEEHARERRERERMPLGATTRGRQPVGQPLEHGAERFEKTWRDGFTRERLANPEAQGERGFSRHGAEALQRAERAARRMVERQRHRAHRAGGPARAPTGADQPPRRSRERAGKPTLRVAGEPLRRRAHGPFGVSSLEREDAEGVVARHQQHPRHARRLHRHLSEPGPGWHGLPRRCEAERAKQVAKIIDPLGAGEQFPQHHGPLAEDGPTVRCLASETGTELARRGPESCKPENGP